MLENLETALESSKEKLKSEQKLRREAETARDNLEVRCQELSEGDTEALVVENKALREECDNALTELALKSTELEKERSEKNKLRTQLDELKGRLENVSNAVDRKASSSSVQKSDGESTVGGRSNRTGSSSHMDESYVEVLDELENVTEQFIATQQKLWKTEDLLREAEMKNKSLQNSLDSVDGNDDETIEYLKDENRIRLEEEKTLREELEVTKEELEIAQRELRATELELEEVQAQSGNQSDRHHSNSEVEATVKTAYEEVERYETLLEEARAENAVLKDELFCLRGEAIDKNDLAVTDEDDTMIGSHAFGMKEDIVRETREAIMRETKQSHEQDIGMMREKLKVLFKENIDLRHQVKQADKKLGVGKDNVAFKEEIARLNAELKRLQDDKVSSLPEESVLLNELNLVCAENEALQVQIEDYKKVLLATRKENEKNIKEWADAESKLAASQQNVSELNGKVEWLQNEIERVGGEKYTGDDIQSTSPQYDEQIFTDKIKSLTTLLDQTRSDYKLLLEQYEAEIAKNDQSNSSRSSGEKERSNAIISELQDQLEKSHTRLCQAEEENARLKDQAGIQVLSKFFEGNQQRTREARDPEASNDIHDAPNKDPPSSESVDFRGLLETSSRSDLENGGNDLRHRVNELTEENMQLKQTVDQRDQSSSTISELTSRLNDANEETERLRNKVSGLNTALRTMLMGTSNDGGGESGLVNVNDQLDLERRVMGDQFSILYQENSILQGKLDAAQESLLKLANHHGLKSEKLKILEDGLIVSTEETTKLREKIAELQLALVIADDSPPEMEDLHRALKESEARLETCQSDLRSSEQSISVLVGEKRQLEEEIDSLKMLVDQVKILRDESTQELERVKAQFEVSRMEYAEENQRSLRDDEFHSLKAQLDKMLEEKAALQHCLNDSEVALSVSKYAQDKNKEDILELQNKLGSSQEEVMRLRAEVSKLSTSLSMFNDEYHIIRKTLHVEQPTIDGTPSLLQPIRSLTDEAAELKRQVASLKEDLSKCTVELEQKKKDASTAESNLVASRNETALLTEELSKLSTAFENAKSEYYAVVDELENVNEQFESAQYEAERFGRENMAQELQKELQAAREKERELMKTKMKEVFEENVSFQRKIIELERSLFEHRSVDPSSESNMIAQKETAMLKEALQESIEESKTLKENVLSLKIELAETQQELQAALDEIDNTSLSEDEIRGEIEQSIRASTIAELRENLESKEQNTIREHLQQLAEASGSSLLAENEESTQKVEGMKLKVELLDMSMTLEKALKENVLLEEELRSSKDRIEQACKDAAKQSRIAAMKEARAQSSSERAKEMKEFKAQFESLAEENSSLQRSLKDAEIAISVAMKKNQCSHEEIKLLEEKLRDSQEQSHKFHEQMLTLSLELETTSKDNKREMKQLQATVHAEYDAKFRSLKKQAKSLALENKTLQQQLYSQGGPDNMNKSDSSPALHVALQNSQEMCMKLQHDLSELQKELYELKHANSLLTQSLQEKERLQKDDMSKAAALESEIGIIKSQLLKRDEELVRFKAQVSQLEDSLLRSKQELEASNSNIFATALERKESSIGETIEVSVFKEQLESLLNEKTALQQKVDDTTVALTVSEYSLSRKEEEIEAFKQSLEDSKQEVLSLKSELSQIKIDSETTKTEQMQVVRELDDINGTLEKALKEDSQTKSQSSSKKHSSLDEKVNEVKGALGEDASTLSDRSNLTHKKSALSALSNLKGQASKLVSVLKQSRKDYSDKVGKLRSVTKRVEEIRREAEALGRETAENDLRKTLVAEKDVEMKSLREQMKSFLAENNDLEQKLRELESSLSETRESEKQYKIELEECQRKLEEAETNSKSLNKKIDSMRRELNNSNHRVRILSNETKTASGEKVEDTERKELMDQFKKFYDENVSLQEELEKTKAELTAVQTRLETSDGSKISELEAENQELTQKLRTAISDLGNAKMRRDSVQKELDAVKSKLASGQTTDASAPSSKSDDMKKLQEEFNKLLLKSSKLEERVSSAENNVEQAKEEHEQNRKDTKRRLELARKLKEQIEKATMEFERRDKDISDLTTTLETKVEKAEMDVVKLENELTSTKNTLHVAQAGIVVARKEEEASADDDSKAVNSRDSGSSSNSESRDDETSSMSRGRQSADTIESLGVTKDKMKLSVDTKESPSPRARSRSLTRITPRKKSLLERHVNRKSSLPPSETITATSPMTKQSPVKAPHAENPTTPTPQAAAAEGAGGEDEKRI